MRYLFYGLSIEKLHLHKLKFYPLAQGRLRSLNSTYFSLHTSPCIFSGYVREIRKLCLHLGTGSLARLWRIQSHSFSGVSTELYKSLDDLICGDFVCSHGLHSSGLPRNTSFSRFLRKYIATYDLVDFLASLLSSLHRILHLSQCCHHLHRISLASCLLDLGVLLFELATAYTRAKDKKLTLTRMNTLWS